VPIATTAGVTFVRYDGHLWDLTPWLPGTADFEESPRVEKLRAAMRALAEFHLAVADFPARPPLASSRGPAPAVTHRLARLRELQNSGIESLTRAITAGTWPDLAPFAREFAAELPRVVPLALARLAPLADVPLPLQPCIRDIWHDHVLFDGDTVTGLVDFGAMQFDTPATDVARLLGSLVGDDPIGWRDGLAAYSTTRLLSDQESLAVFALDAAGTILAGCNWVRWIYIEGRRFECSSRIKSRVTNLVARIQCLH
jgi:homoserine kinase type II